MPFKSKAQRRKFYGDKKLRHFAREWEQDTPDSLPERMRGKRKVRRAKKRMKRDGGR